MKTLIGMMLAFACANAFAASGVLKGTVTSSNGPAIESGFIDVTINGAAATSLPIGVGGTYSGIETWAGAGSASCELRTVVSGYIEQSVVVQLADGGTTQTDFVLVWDVIFRDAFETGS